MPDNLPAIDPKTFWDALKGRGLTFFSGVPDSTFQRTYNAMVADPEIRYVPAVREDVALGVASAAYFRAGSGGNLLGSSGLGGVMMQNSGIGNIVNPLTSFNLLYRIPALLVVGWRGYGGPPNDAPEHWIMGERTTEFFDLLQMPYEILEPGELETALDLLLGAMERQSVPGALLVRPGVLE